MKATSVALALAVLVLALAGCESMSDATQAVRERVAPRAEPRMKEFSASPRLVYEGVRAAAGQMGYRFVRGGPAQGAYEAVSGIDTAERAGSARQIRMKVQLHPTLDAKGTEVSVLLTEIIEADSTNRAGLATETPLRDTPQYEVFFRRVEQALGAANPQAK